MYAEGIPNSVNICREMRTKHAELMKNYEELMDSFIELRQEVRHNNNELNTLVRTELPRQIAHNISSTFEINGAIALTTDNAKQVFTELINQPEGPIHQLLEGQKTLMAARSNSSHSGTADPTGCSAGTTDATSNSTRYSSLHLWAGSEQFHQVPQHFQWPSDTPHTMWQLWFRGNPAQNIGPYKGINPRFDLPSKTCKCKQAKTARVISALINIAISSGLITRNTDISDSNLQYIFEQTYPTLLEKVYGGSHPRPHDIMTTTIANKLYNMQLFF